MLIKGEKVDGGDAVRVLNMSGSKIEEEVEISQEEIERERKSVKKTLFFIFIVSQSIFPRFSFLESQKK